MSALEKFTYSIITAVLVFLAAVVALPFGARAEDSFSCELSEIRTEAIDAAYYCFDTPIAVYADDSAILVSGKNALYSVVNDTEFGKTVITEKNAVADKLCRIVLPADATEYRVALHNGKIGVYLTDNTLEYWDMSVEIADFVIAGSTIYALTETQIIYAPLVATGIDSEKAITVALTSNKHSEIAASRIASMGGKLYITLRAAFGTKQDVCSLDIATLKKSGAGALSVVLTQSNIVLSMSTNTETNVLYALTRGELAAYAPSVGGELIKSHGTSGSELIDIYAFGSHVYALDTLNGLRDYSVDLSAYKLVAASAGAAAGFFNTPSGISVNNSTIYIADTENNRIAAYTRKGTTYLNRKFNRPVSAVADSAGNLYVAYDGNKVGIFKSKSYAVEDEITVTNTNIGKIKQLAIDAEKNLFVLADSGLWRVGQDYSVKRLNETKYDAITLSLGRNKLYVLSGNVVICLDKNGAETQRIFNIGENAISFAVDLNDTVFALYRDKLARFDTNGATVEYGLKLNGNAYTLGERSGQIALGFFETGLPDELADTENTGVTNYLVILDSYRHRALKASGDAIGARFVDFSYAAPDIIANGATIAQTANMPQSGIICTARYDTPLYPYPLAAKSSYGIVAGRNVIVPDCAVVAPEYDPTETPEFVLVLIDDTVTNTLKQGFVYRDALTSPLTYSRPPSEICTITGELGAKLYKWPSRNSAAIDGYAEVEKGKKFKMLDFVNPFRDDYGFYWYRVSIADIGCEGYVTAVNVTTVDYRPTNIMPEYNAEIISHDGSTAAATYTTDADGKYSATDITLKTGTKVEVVGIFDSSERFTKIKFLDGKTHATLTCYVETVYLKYSGINIVLLVALLVILITTLFAIIIICKVYGAQRKPTERPHNIDEDEDNRHDKHKQ